MFSVTLIISKFPQKIAQLSINLPLHFMMRLDAAGDHILWLTLTIKMINGVADGGP